jgi:hypothetical protein
MLKHIAVTALLAPIMLAYAGDDVAVPQIVSYQGKLLNSQGNPVRDSTYSVVFSLFPSATGGSAFWIETRLIETRGGLFNCLLGLVTPIAGVPADGNCYLEMQVNPDPPLSPRIRIASSAYSFLARKSDTANYALVVARPLTPPISSAEIADTNVTMAKIQPAGAVTGQVIQWNGANWTPANLGTGSNYWSVSGPDYIYPNAPGSGNTGIRVYRSGAGSYNLFGSTNARGQFGLYGITNFDSSFGVGGENTQYGVQGILGYGFYRNLAPKAYPCGVYGSGGSGRDGIYGTSAAPTCFGVWGHNSGTTGTGLAGSGNNQTASLPADGAGGAFTGYKYGIYCHATDLVSGDQTAGGYFQADASTTNNRAWVACWTTGGNGYRLIGNGTCVQGFLTRDGERVLASLEMPEARLEDAGHGRLKDGRCRIELDPLFSDCIQVSGEYPLDVYVQLTDDCNGVYVKADELGFGVYELQGGRSNAGFNWRVLAHPKEEKHVRFADAPRALKGSGADRK